MAGLTVVPIVTAAGAVPTDPDVIRATLVNIIAGGVPGYTDDLPASMVEDMLSTEVASIAQIDAAFVDCINSIAPSTSNSPIILQQGQVAGVPFGLGTNTSANVEFTGPPGYVIQVGYTVGDGTYQYVVQDGGVIPSGGTTIPLYVLATQPGTWVVPPGTITQLITQPPPGISLSVTNPLAGTPSPGPQSEEDYRAQVLLANKAPAQGMQSYLKSLLGNQGLCPGVVPRLVSVVQVNSGGWEVIVGGGDPYQIAYAINTALFDVSTLVGSTIAVAGVTNATLGVVDTNLNHGLTTGQSNVHIAGVVGMTGVNGGPYAVTVIDETHFTFGVNTTSSGAYVSGGVVTPNARNQVVNLSYYPDSYSVKFVLPPQQTVLIDVTWNTDSPNYVPPSAVSQLGAPALATYINSIPVGAPINLFELQNVFQASVANLFQNIQFLTRMVFTVSINGVSTAPLSGTGIIQGDPESYFYCTPTGVTITQG